MNDNIKSMRKRIDALDRRLVKLLSARARLAQRVGKVKAGAAYRPEREAQVLRGVLKSNSGPLSDAALSRLFTEIMSACRALEDSLAVAYLGPQGTFSQEAALKHFGALAVMVPCASIDEVFRQVETGAVGYAVVPVENSTEGAIGRTLDLLLATPSKICGEVMLPIRQCLMSRERRLSGIRKVYSHTQSLAQCQQWLARALPQAERVAVVSNAEAARLAARERRAAAIGPKTAAALYRLDLLARNIEDEAEKHYPLPRARGARCGAFRPRQDIAGHVHAQRAGRGARAAHAARGEPREHDAGSNHGRRARASGSTCSTWISKDTSRMRTWRGRSRSSRRKRPS